MKKISMLKFILLLTLFITLIVPTPALAAQPGKLVVGDSYTLASGDTLDEDLMVMGGTVILEESSRVTGNVLILGGTITVLGEVDGNIRAVGGYVHLGDSAVVRGDLLKLGAALDMDPGADIRGEIREGDQGPFDWELPGGVRVPDIGFRFSPFWEALWFLARVFIFSALAVLIVMFFEKPTRRVVDTLVSQPLISGGMGVLTIVVAPFVVLILMITILLIPVGILLTLALGLLLVFGWVALGLEVGKRLTNIINKEWAAPLQAGVGTFLLTFVLGSIGFVPCVGWIFPFAAAMIGLGAVLLTRVGMQPYLGSARSTDLLSPVNRGEPQASGDQTAANVTSTEES